MGISDGVFHLLLLEGKCQDEQPVRELGVNGYSTPERFQSEGGAPCDPSETHQRAGRSATLLPPSHLPWVRLTKG